jgi:predicted component of type VI protein secretion system
MKHRYYTLPLRLDEVIQGKDLDQCTLEESIRQHIHLLLTTSFGEIEYDTRFGCMVWDTDFDNLSAVNKLRDQLKQSVRSVILQYEQRLENVSAEIAIRQEEAQDSSSGRRVKKRIILQINGTMKLNHQPFSFTDSFLAGPLSYEL